MNRKRATSRGRNQSLGRPPFVVSDRFIENAFECRFQGILKDAHHERSWYVIGAEPGSGKSFGIRDFVKRQGAHKAPDAVTTLPALDVVAPNGVKTQRALGLAIAMSLGRTPSMPWERRRVWLVEELLRLGVEIIIVDDAHQLGLDQLGLLRELTDQVTRLRDGPRVGLCLVSASNGHDIPLVTLLLAHAAELEWRQFLRRLHAEHPFLLVENHSKEEMGEICAGFEDLYRAQMPRLSLVEWADALYTWLTSPILDPSATGRVTMDNATKLIVPAITEAHALGLDAVTADILHGAATRMTHGRYLPRVVGGAEDTWRDTLKYVDETPHALE